MQGLLLNSRMVQARFDDENELTRPLWAYPDTGMWDPERNMSECIAAMPSWKEQGLAAITVNLQGGRPMGYGGQQRGVLLERFRARGIMASEEALWAGAPYPHSQPWHNSAFAADGRLQEPYVRRLARVLDAADALGMVVIVSLFYQGQDERLRDEAAIRFQMVPVNWTINTERKHGFFNLLNEVTGA
ncbi:MAG: hypothetical protein ACRDJN_31435 [Chloroflexota bacterium]